MVDKPKPAPAKPARPNDGVQAFINALQSAPSGDHVLHGMVKPAETTDGLMFAHAGRCDHWIYIPVSAIQAVQPTGRIGCKSHSHVSAAIQLKAPETDLEKAFASVANLHEASLFPLKGAVQAPPDPGCPPGTTWKQNEWDVWGCWP